jgi:hypothetical protein
VWRKNKGANQRWNIVYVDEAPKPLIKDIEKAYGMQANNPFIIRSRMPMRRVVEARGGGNITLRTLVRGRKS